MSPVNSESDYSDEVVEIQHHLVHLNADHHHHHHLTLVETINALFHANNGSHSGNGNDLSLPTTEEELSEDLLIVLFTLVPLVLAIGIIFLIAVAIRKMRRAESLQEMVRRQEFKSHSDKSSNKKPVEKTSSNPLDAFRKSKSKSNGVTNNLASSMSFHEIRVVPAPAPAKGRGSTASSSCSQSSDTPPTSLYFSQTPPWYLQSTPYYRSQYHLTKLQRQLSQGGSLQSFGSTPSLECESHSLEYHSQSEGHTISDTEADNYNSSSSPERKKKSKRLSRVIQMMNIPKRVRQQRVEKNRFNVYDIPKETREQLKQIYVY